MCCQQSRLYSLYNLVAHASFGYQTFDACNPCVKSLFYFIGNSFGIPMKQKSTTVQDAHAAPMEIWLLCSRAAAQCLASETLCSLLENCILCKKMQKISKNLYNFNGQMIVFVNILC